MGIKKALTALCCAVGITGSLFATTALEIVNGASGYVESQRNITGSTFTSIMWVKMNPTGGNGALYGLGSSSTNANTAFWVNSSGTLTFYNKWPEGYATNDGLMTSHFNKWTHLAFVGVAGEGVKVYINGTLAWTVTDTKSTAVAQDITANGFVTLGRNLDGLEPQNGTSYDEFSLWSKAFSDAEVLANYNNGGGTEFTGSEQNLELYWKFEDGAGSAIATDSSQQARNGSIAGTEGTDYKWTFSKDVTIYDDFENGYAKWTATGTAFGSNPINTATTNSSGYYAISINDSSATGLLTSETFTVDKDFINFKLTGGAEPTQGIRLVIGGTPVITWSGNVGWGSANVANFILESWDVSDYKGQTAHFEIFDNGSDAKDWVAVDDITFSTKALQKGTVFELQQPSYMEWHYTKRMANFATNDSSVPTNSTVLLGDSITEVFPMGNAPARWNLVNRGIQGDCVGGWKYLGLYDRLQECVYQHQPANVFIAIGINDIVQWYPSYGTSATVDQLEAGYKAIVEGIQANSPSTKIYLQTVLPTTGQYAEYNDEVIAVNTRIAKVATETGVNFLDTHSDFKNSSGELEAAYSSDGIHLTSAGYAVWYAALTKVLDGQEEQVEFETAKEITLEGYDSKTFETPTNPSNGTLTPAADFTTSGKVTYTPNSGYSGADSFTYTVTGDSRPFTVYINVEESPANIPGPAIGKSLQITSTTADTGQVVKDLSAHTALNELTFEFWAKVPTAANSKNWVSLIMLESSMAPVGLAMGGTGGLVPYTGGNAHNYINIDDRFLNQWHHYAITIELSATGDPIPADKNEAGRRATRVYIDGYNIFTEQNELRFVSSIGDLSSSWGNGSNGYPAVIDLGDLTCGGWTSGATFEIDEIRIWKEARTQTQIRENMNRTNVNGANLLVNYKCDGDTADLVDSSSTGSTATNVVTGNLGRTTSYAQVFDASPLSGWNFPDSIGESKTATRTDGGLKVDNATVTAGDYVVETAINSSEEVVTTELPIGIVERFEREWFVQEVGTVVADMTFDTTNIVDTLPAQSEAKLLYRSTTSEDFTEVATASSSNGNEFTFSSVSFMSGYYTFGASTTLTPSIGLQVSQTDDELTWTVEDEIGVKEYQIFVDGELFDIVQAVDADFYSLEVPVDAKVELKVVDESGYSKTYLPQDGNTTIEVYDLEEGWNLVAITSDKADLETLRNETVGELWGWNGSGYEVVETAKATDAVWVYSPIAKQVYISGTKSDAKIKLNLGWNMVGPVENDFIPEGADTVYSWSEVYDVIAGEDKVLIGGKGYWIFSL